MNDHPEAIITINGRSYETDLLVFDKDGNFITVDD